MNRISIGVGVALVGLVMACGSGGKDSSTPAPVKTTVAAPTAGEQAYLAGLAKIDAGLVANKDRALRRAKDTCADIRAGEVTGAALAKRVAERLSGGDVTVTDAQAQQVIDLAKQTVCK